jgi:SAM-dependent methyltransferase
MAYEHFYQFYDRLMQDVPYEKYTQLIQDLATNHGQILDLGCGTGTVLSELLQAGLLVDGLDLNEDMLLLTQEKLNNLNLHTSLYLDDMRTLSRLDYYELVYSFLDTINYLTTKDDVRATFAGVYHILKQGGQFVFDVHSIHYVESVFTDYSFHDDFDDLTYIWDIETDTTPDATIIKHYLSFFIKDHEHYSRLDEVHTQMAFPISYYLTVLKEVGFKEIKVLSDFQPGINSEAAKYIIICKKY